MDGLEVVRGYSSKNVRHATRNEGWSGGGKVRSGEGALGGVSTTMMLAAMGFDEVAKGEMQQENIRGPRQNRTAEERLGEDQFEEVPMALGG